MFYYYYVVFYAREIGYVELWQGNWITSNKLTASRKAHKVVRISNVAMLILCLNKLTSIVVHIK